MSATLFASELTNLIAEAKRKNNDLKTAAVKSLQELKSLPNTSESQLAHDLSKRPAFVEPFLLACQTKHVKISTSGISCLQRLIVLKALPKSCLSQALDAFNACSDLGLDVQLKVLQALPSLLQNYAADLKGDRLAAALQICAFLQSAKVQTVSGVAAATLQQLVTAVFENVVLEDENATAVPATIEVPGDQEPILLRPAAYDAYRVFRDLVLSAEDRPTTFVQFKTLGPESSLELIWSSIDANGRLLEYHPELVAIIQSNLLPFVTRALSEKIPFPLTVRSLRILDLVLTKYMSRFPGECEVALGLMVHDIDSDSSPAWKRALVMECVHNVFANGSIVIDAFMMYDQGEGAKPVISDIMSSFVRLSSEKPTAIGLAQQSAIPTGSAQMETGSEQVTMEAAGGMAGVISSAFGVAEISIPGISSQWSIPRVAFLDQLDKSEPSPPPETYIYALVLDCLSSISETLARAVLPLTVRQGADRKEHQPVEKVEKEGRPTSRGNRSQSFRQLAVPLDPLASAKSPAASKAHAVAKLIDGCWPAVLATCSTFLNAALEDHYYRNLIKAYQRFVQVAGLLRLKTPRDALMTTLSKSAVPPHILNAATADPLKSPQAKSPAMESASVFSNPKNLLSVDALVSQALDREKRVGNEPTRAVLTPRNLLCLRALLNIAIALGPTLDTAFAVVFDALRQADLVLSMASPQQMARQGAGGAQKPNETPLSVQAFITEVNAVEGAAARLLESTADYPNEAFVTVVTSFCRFLTGRRPRNLSPASEHSLPSSPLPREPGPRRTLSGLPGLSAMAELQARDYQFVIPKLGRLAQMNISRFVANEPEESGWNIIVDELSQVASAASRPREARLAAAEVLCKMAAETIGEVSQEDEEHKLATQDRAISVFRQILNGIYANNEEVANTDYELHGHVLDAVRAVLEHSGESLVSGWGGILAIVSTAFVRSQPANIAVGDVKLQWQTVGCALVSIPVGRNAFAATQLICSDFLALLPSNVILDLIQLLGRFIRQTDDLNVALTTVTMAWNLSDFLFGLIEPDELEQTAKNAADTADAEQNLITAGGDLRASQSLLLLFQLRSAVHETSPDVRNALFQTICSVFKSHGDKLSPDMWDVTLRSVFMKVAADDASRYSTGEDDESRGPTNDVEISKTIITGTADIISQYIKTIERVPKLASLWEAVLSRMEAYLDVGDHSLNSAVYSALSQILSNVDVNRAVWSSPAYRTVALWLQRAPERAEDAPDKNTNQEPFLAYTECAIELYRLTRESMGAPQLKKLVENLYKCVRQSDGPRYGADVNAMSPVQGHVLSLLKSLRLDLPNVPSCLITVASRFINLAHDASKNADTKQGPTFVALAETSIQWMETLCRDHMNHTEIVETGSLLQALQSLQRLIVSKYSLVISPKAQPLWQIATRVVLSLSPAVLNMPNVDPKQKTSFLAEYVTICGGIIKANGLHDTVDPQRVFDDQLSDIDAFRRLRRVLVSHLGSQNVPDSCRMDYALSVFDASIIHTSPWNDRPARESPLKGLSKVGRGQVQSTAFEEREDMCYECFEELSALASSENTALATAAAPYLLLRLALPLESFIADQPLRGKRPTPLSQEEELLYCFQNIKKLELNPDALGEDMGEKAHVPYLYPLLVRASIVSCDKYSGTPTVLQPLQEVLQAIAPPI